MFLTVSHNALTVNSSGKTAQWGTWVDFVQTLIKLIYKLRDDSIIKDKLLNLFKYVVSGFRIKKWHFE